MPKHMFVPTSKRMLLPHRRAPILPHSSTSSSNQLTVSTPSYAQVTATTGTTSTDPLVPTAMEQIHARPTHLEAPGNVPPANFVLATPAQVAYSVSNVDQNLAKNNNKMLQQPNTTDLPGATPRVASNSFTSEVVMPAQIPASTTTSAVYQLATALPSVGTAKFVKPKPKAAKAKRGRKKVQLMPSKIKNVICDGDIVTSPPSSPSPALDDVQLDLDTDDVEESVVSASGDMTHEVEESVAENVGQQPAIEQPAVGGQTTVSCTKQPQYEKWSREDCYREHIRRENKLGLRKRGLPVKLNDDGTYAHTRDMDWDGDSRPFSLQVKDNIVQALYNNDLETKNTPLWTDAPFNSTPVKKSKKVQKRKSNNETTEQPKEASILRKSDDAVARFCYILCDDNHFDDLTALEEGDTREMLDSKCTGDNNVFWVKLTENFMDPDYAHNRAAAQAEMDNEISEDSGSEDDANATDEQLSARVERYRVKKANKLKSLCHFPSAPPTDIWRQDWAVLDSTQRKLVERMEKVNPMDMTYTKQAKKLFGDLICKVAVRKRLTSWWRDIKTQFAVVQTNKEKSGHHAASKMNFFQGKMFTLLMYTYLYPRGENALAALCSVAGGPLDSGFSSAFTEASDCEEKPLFSTADRIQSSKNAAANKKKLKEEEAAMKEAEMNQAADKVFMQGVQMIIEHEAKVRESRSILTVSNEIVQFKKNIAEVDDEALRELFQESLDRATEELKTLLASSRSQPDCGVVA